MMVGITIRGSLSILKTSWFAIYNKTIRMEAFTSWLVKNSISTYRLNILTEKVLMLGFQGLLSLMFLECLTSISNM